MTVFFRRAIAAGLLAFSASIACDASNPALAQATQGIQTFETGVEQYAKTLVDMFKVPGLAILVQKDGRVIASHYAGYCSVELKVRVTDRCVFHLASSSKLFAGTAMMMLAQQGRVKLDDPVSKYLSDLPAAWRNATIRQIMSHTSGIPNFFQNPDFDKLSPQDKWKLSAEQLIAFAANEPLDGQPGEKWAYAQTGPLLAGLIIEKVTGRPFADYMRSNVFDPLGMTQTRYGDTSVVIEERSPTAYRWNDGVLRTHAYPFEPPLYPAAGLNSSPHDLARFFEALSSNRLLSDASKAAMWKRVRLKGGETYNYALGWDVRKHSGLDVVQHSGAGSVWLGHVPKEKLTIIVLTNLNGLERELEKSANPSNPILGLLDLYQISTRRR